MLSIGDCKAFGLTFLTALCYINRHVLSGVKVYLFCFSFFFFDMFEFTTDAEKCFCRDDLEIEALDQHNCDFIAEI